MPAIARRSCPVLLERLDGLRHLGVAVRDLRLPRQRDELAKKQHPAGDGPPGRRDPEPLRLRPQKRLVPPPQPHYARVVCLTDIEDAIAVAWCRHTPSTSQG